MKSKIPKSVDLGTKPLDLSTNTSNSAVVTNGNIPNIYFTPANPSIPIPEGRIIDDSSRGTLFWEVLGSKHNKMKKGISSSSKSKQNTNTHGTKDDSSSSSEDDSVGNNWTVPFQIEWLSIPGKTVPFYMVKHLKNSYNDNQPVNIARDGTEIEPEVGQQIIKLFKS